MKVFADLHIHSSYSRACSKDITITNLEKYARIKGLNLLGTGDFTHPSWLKNLKENLVEDGSGILKTKSGFNFLLQTEISNIYMQDGKQRRIHNVILAPSFEIVDQINDQLLKYGRLDYDGRPIFGFSCVELVEIMKSISNDIEIIPAHAWTPWYGIFGSKSGFDSIDECFQEKSKYIHAIETGLSSDPPMNWRLSKLDNITLVSFSDSHSHWPWRIGREATVFDVKKLTYNELITTIREKNPKKLLFTIEVDPSYGKYHFDGHRNCNISLSPKESEKYNNICPVCGRELTIGVLHRVEELADRPEGFRPENAIPFKSLVPLSEILAHSLGIEQIYSKKIWEKYNKLISAFGSEFKVLLEVSKAELENIVHEKVAEAIIAIREGRVEIQPGYDGVYGKLIFKWEDKEKTEVKTKVKQHALMDFSKNQNEVKSDEKKVVIGKQRTINDFQ